MDSVYYVFGDCLCTPPPMYLVTAPFRPDVKLGRTEKTSGFEMLCISYSS